MANCSVFVLISLTQKSQKKARQPRPAGSRQFIQRMDALDHDIDRGFIDFGGGFGNTTELGGGGVSSGFQGNLYSFNWTSLLSTKLGKRNRYLIVDDGAMGGKMRFCDPSEFHLLQNRISGSSGLTVTDITKKAKGIADFSSIAKDLQTYYKPERKLSFHQVCIRGNDLELFIRLKTRIDFLEKTFKAWLLINNRQP